MPAPSEITTREALAILGYREPATISRYVRAGKLTPSRKAPGKRGAMWFWQHDIEQLAAEQRRQREEAS